MLICFCETMHSLLSIGSPSPHTSILHGSNWDRASLLSADDVNHCAIRRARRLQDISKIKHCVNMKYSTSLFPYFQNVSTLFDSISNCYIYIYIFVFSCFRIVQYVSISFYNCLQITICSICFRFVYILIYSSTCYIW